MFPSCTSGLSVFSLLSPHLTEPAESGPWFLPFDAGRQNNLQLQLHVFTASISSSWWLCVQEGLLELRESLWTSRTIEIYGLVGKHHVYVPSKYTVLVSSIASTIKYAIKVHIPDNRRCLHDNGMLWRRVINTDCVLKRIIGRYFPLFSQR